MQRSKTFLIAVLAGCIALAMLPAAAFSVTRDQAVARGMVWANYVRIDPKTHKRVTGVPYSQSRWAYENGDLVPTSTPNASSTGYRTDCSGFVSLCWNLRDSSGRPYSASTTVFGTNKSSLFKLEPLSKDDLEPGDMLLASSLWGASSPHAILFDGWANSSRTQFWALEQTTISTHDGTILRVRDYGQKYYRAFRNIALGDAYADCQDRIDGPDACRSAAKASSVAFPATGTVGPTSAGSGRTAETTVPAVVLANSALPADQLSGAVVAGAVGGPLLLTAKWSVPASTVAEIQRLKPKRIIVLGSSSRISGYVASLVATYAPVTRLSGKSDAEVAGAAARFAVPLVRSAGRVVDTAYVVRNTSTADALQVAPIVAKTGRPLLYLQGSGVAYASRNALKTLGIRKVVVVGGTKAVSASAYKTLRRKTRATLQRLTGKTSARQSITVANHGISLGMTWGHLGLSSTTSFRDAVAAAAAQGQMGQLILMTPRASLDSSVRNQFAAHKAEVGRARVYGTTAAVSSKARSSLASVLRATP